MLDPTALDAHFPRYTQYDPQVPVWCLTPGEGGAFHRFFDTWPISPSGRYLAVLRMPDEKRMPVAGQAAKVCVVDLHTGEDRAVADTRGWESQMGANLNWGPDDHQLIFNDCDPDTWRVFAVNCDPATGAKRRLGGPVYHVSPDGMTACASNPTTMRRTQDGYGAVIPDDRVPRFVGPHGDDGLWLTDTQTGESRLILSIKDAIQRATPPFEIDDPDQWEIYGFHSKFNPQGDRLIFTLRFFRDNGESRWNMMGSNKNLHFTVLTLDTDGRNVCNAVPTRYWRKCGHHINWQPDGRSLSMNLTLEDELQFVGCDADGANLRPMVEGVLGSGHPTVHPNGRHILTDTYVREPMAFEDGSIPLRWVDVTDGSEQTLVRIKTRPADGLHAALRIDPHPAWDRAWRWVVFNGFADDTRRVYLADLASVIEA